jgi:hypothetical protein
LKCVPEATWGKFSDLLDLYRVRRDASLDENKNGTALFLLPFNNKKLSHIPIHDARPVVAIVPWKEFLD